MTSPRTRYLLSINEETVGGYCELLWRKGVGDAASPPLCGPEGLSQSSLSQAKPAAAIAGRGK
jgi:hypothetical protein